MSLRHAVRAPLMVLALSLAACGDATAPAAPCTGDVTVQVSSGTTPTITWTPACRLFAVGVEEEVEGDTWFVITLGENGISSGVRYGVVPAGATSDAPAIPLVAGGAYSVFVGRYTGPGPDDGELAGTRAFTP